MSKSDPLFFNIYRLSLLSFILAAATGALFRYGLVYPIPGGLTLDNIRHAHTHLMFFNWVSPPLMAWMASLLITSGTALSSRSVSRCLYVMLALGFLSYPSFLLFGYSPVDLGFAALPVSAIISGLIMLTWYWFAVLYFTHRKEAEKTAQLEIFDGALIALLVSSLGAWGVSAAQFIDGISALIPSALTYFFLNVFTEGWAVIAAIGIIWSAAGLPEPKIKISLLYLPILFGSMLLFPLGFSKSLITPEMLYTARAGLFLIIISLSLNLFFFLTEAKRKNRFLFYTLIVLLLFKIAAQSISLFPNDFWIGSHGLRILYLHLVMLGFISFTLIHYLPFSRKNTPLISSFFIITVWLLLFSLTVISGYWPVSLMIPNIYFWVFLIATLPIIPVLFLLLKPTFRKVNF